jgi:hypothetical protein
MCVWLVCRGTLYLTMFYNCERRQVLSLDHFEMVREAAIGAEHTWRPAEEHSGRMFDS